METKNSLDPIIRVLPLPLSLVPKKILGVLENDEICSIEGRDGNVPTWNEDMRKLRYNYSVNNMQIKGFPAMIGGSVWNKTTKGHAGIRWDREIEEVSVGEDERKPRRNTVHK